jgi:murein DD-endopeptidase MepM/ murein hydrolase activator NlpD
MADRGWISLVWPVPSSKTITQAFGADFETYKRKFGWLIGHSGLDIRTRTSIFPGGIGTPIVAAQGGEIIHAGDHPEKYGITVIIKHPDNTCTLYGHCSETLVRVGNKVQAGQYIARSGNTGEFTSAPHLHFELWDLSLKKVNGVWGRVDPTPFMEDIRFTGGFGDRDIEGAGVPDHEIGPEGDLPIHEGHNLEDGTCGCAPFIPDI